MTVYDASEIPEEAVRLRSYLIWKREGCPDGKALDHWVCAQAELALELQVAPPLRKPTAYVMPRVPISTPPCKTVSARVRLGQTQAAASAAKQ